MRPHKTLMILLRPFTERPVSGREKINLFIRDSISAETDLRIEQYHHILKKRPALGLPLLLWKITRNFFNQDSLPWQLLLFSDASEINRVVAIAKTYQPDTIFLEGIRSFLLIKALRQKFPNTYLVCDFDDLISRRMRAWSEHKDAIALGYMDRFIPSLIKKLLRGPIAKQLCLHEARTLQRAELDCANVAACIVLLSDTEFSIYRHRIKNQSATVSLIPPACVPANLVRTTGGTNQLRFIFIGSDALLQNRLTIEYLLKLWETCRPNTKLHIFGCMTRAYHDTCNVIFHGFIESLDEAYTPESIMLSPSFVEGGVKTKVLESLEHGNIAIGNKVTFEGIATPAAALIPDEALLKRYIAHPDDFYTQWVTETNSMLTRIRQTHSSKRIAELWRQCLIPGSELTTERTPTGV